MSSVYGYNVSSVLVALRVVQISDHDLPSCVPDLMITHTLAPNHALHSPSYSKSVY